MFSKEKLLEDLYRLKKFWESEDEGYGLGYYHHITDLIGDIEEGEYDV